MHNSYQFIETIRKKQQQRKEEQCDPVCKGVSTSSALEESSTEHLGNRSTLSVFDAVLCRLKSSSARKSVVREKKKRKETELLS